MAADKKSIEELIDSLPPDRREIMARLRETIIKALPGGFEETAGDMINYVVPFSRYPAGYHCPPKQPLPFMSLASRKNFIALYHMGVYANEELFNWFTNEYPNHSKYKLDMGKSCIRFKRMGDIPFELIGELVSKMTPDQWITLYESILKK